MFCPGPAHRPGNNGGFGNINMTGSQQRWEMPVKQRQQQYLNMRAIDIGVRQDSDLAVTQAGQSG